MLSRVDQKPLASKDEGTLTDANIFPKKIFNIFTVQKKKSNTLLSLMNKINIHVLNKTMDLY